MSWWSWPLRQLLELNQELNSDSVKKNKNVEKKDLLIVVGTIKDLCDGRVTA